MSYSVSAMIGIRTGGVFSGDADVEAYREEIAKVVKSMGERSETYISLGRGDSLSAAMSKELISRKGGYIVIAGVFNYWMSSDVLEFAKKLSVELDTEVMAMAWEEDVFPATYAHALFTAPEDTTSEQLCGMLRRTV